MGRAKPIELPSKTFAKREDAILFFRAMLHRYRDGERVSMEDSVLLGELLRRHPDDKIGIGLDYFYRDRNPEQPNSGFHLMRLDGRWTDFSFMKCIDGRKPEPYDYYYRACRFAVSHYLTLKKNDLFASGPVFCEQTGEKVTKESSEYRHTTPSFKELVDRFATENHLQIDWGMFTPDRDRQYNVRFLDPELEQRFIDFHQANAKLAIFGKSRG
jgi:hypothetical protein